MLRITIELVPGGRESDAQVIALGSITNTSNLDDVSSYTLAFAERPWKGRERGPYIGRLRNWPRNERGAWEIVSAALNVAISPLAGQRDGSKTNGNGR